MLTTGKETRFCQKVTCMLAFVVGFTANQISAQVGSAPQLKITRAPDNLTLNWSNDFGNPYYLQYTTTLAGTNVWNNSPDLNTNGSLATISDTPTNPACFYRLTAWDVLFNGQTLNFLGAGSTYFPSNSWNVVSNELRKVSGATAVSLITATTYTNFELRLEWAASTTTDNSGIFYFWNQPQACPEMQLVYNPGYPQYTTNQLCGSLYTIIAPTNYTLNALNQFNTVRLVVNNGRVEHWLNDRIVVSYNLNNPAVTNSYGTLTNGSIGLQFHNGASRFRNIFIRRLPSSP